ncbi:hypothetical protein DICVIV_10651 [Dictyocaulus viviparus]|uniref:Uncharacterized protein n=1 Tax=Dictyocaulus viviparus TaxID=29172 RepID=A0A0D8XHU5_DICVI|nr:hypothetical protein DICVIV_10651 [Dictyocaulus viviparus]
MDSSLQAINAENQPKCDDDVTWARSGSVLRRVKRGNLEPPNQVFIKDGKWINYCTSCFLKFLPKRVKSG